MDQNQFERLSYMDAEPVLFKVSELLDRTDRTLLLGYTVEREDFHVYLKNGFINILVGKKVLYESLWIIEAAKMTPSKRLYPEACDFETCILLRRKGIYLPFTTWGSLRREALLGVYYGRGLWEGS